MVWILKVLLHLHECMTVKGSCISGHLFEDVSDFWEAGGIQQFLLITFDHGQAHAEYDLTALVK